MDETQDAPTLAPSPPKKRHKRSPEEQRELNRQYCRAHQARLRAKAAGEEGPPLLRRPYGPDDDRRTRAQAFVEANRERIRAEAHARYLVSREAALAKQKVEHARRMKEDPEYRAKRAEWRKRSMERLAASPELMEEYRERRRITDRKAKRKALLKRSEEERLAESERLRNLRSNLTPEQRAEMNARKAEANRRRRATERGKVYTRMSAAMSNALKRFNASGKARSSWVSLVGYTVEDLAARLKKTMPQDYTWADFMTGELHIEHIVPVSAFNFTTPQCHDFKRCWALSNLRLLPALENLKKGTKLLAPFQPSLL